MIPKFPKYMVEVDFEGKQDGLLQWWPTRPLWVARMRNPFCLGQIVLPEPPAERIGIRLWPPIIEGDRVSLADKLTRALLRDFDIYPGDFQPPVIGPMLEPPRYLHTTRPDSTAEYILEPHGPALWKVMLNRQLDCTGATWMRGFGVEPSFPAASRDVAEFCKTL
jgi:hypothetical protein